MLRRSPTTFGVLLSFSFFAGLLTLLLLAQKTIPERNSETLEALPTEVVGPSILEPSEQPTQEPSSQSGSTAPGSTVVTVSVPGGPAVIAPVGALGPQVNEPIANPAKDKKPGDKSGTEPKPPGEQPSTPVGPVTPSPPGGESPTGQPSPPPAVLPPAIEPDDDDDDESGGDEGENDDTDTDDGGDNESDPDGDGKGSKSGKARGDGEDDD